MRRMNSHSLQSERNWTPEKLWANGMMDLRNSCYSFVEVQESINREALEDLKWFFMEWYLPTPSDEGLSKIKIPNLHFLISIRTLIEVQIRLRGVIGTLSNT